MSIDTQAELAGNKYERGNLARARGGSLDAKEFCLVQQALRSFSLGSFCDESFEKLSLRKRTLSYLTMESLIALLWRKTCKISEIQKEIQKEEEEEDFKFVSVQLTMKGLSFDVLVQHNLTKKFFAFHEVLEDVKSFAHCTLKSINTHSIVIPLIGGFKSNEKKV